MVLFLVCTVIGCDGGETTTTGFPTSTGYTTTTLKPSTTTTEVVTTTIPSTTTTKLTTTTTIPSTTTTIPTTTTKSTTTTIPTTTTTVPSTTTTKLTTTTIPSTTTTKLTTTTTKPPTSTTTTTIPITTTTSIPGNTTTTVTNPSFWRDEWPDLSEGLVCNVVHFGANPADDGGDDGPYIQNAIDFAAGEKTLAQVAPVSMSATWREYYKFWEDAKRAQVTGDWTFLDKYLSVSVETESDGINPWFAAILALVLLVLSALVLFLFQYFRRRYNILGRKK